MTYNFLTAGLQNVLATASRRVEQSYFHLLFLRSVLRIASCVGPNFALPTLLTFSSVYHH